MFDREHEKLYGYALRDHPLDLVNVRATCIGRLPKPILGQAVATGRGPAVMGSRRAYVPIKQSFELVPIYGCEDIDEGSVVEGPSIVEMPQTAIMVPASFQLHRDAHGAFVLSRPTG